MRPSRRRRAAGATTLAALLAASIVPLHAGRAAAPVGYDPELSVRAGTLGIGPELGLRIPGSQFGVRADLNLFSFGDDDLYERHFSNGNALTGYDLTARFDGTLRLLNGGLTLDWYPLGTGLRLSAGIYGDGNRITARAVPTGTARIGDRSYGVADAGTVSLKALVNDVAPFVGLGYAGQVVRHVVFSIDAGILVESDPDVSTATSGPAAALPSFETEVEHVRRTVRDDIAVPVYPVLMLGLGYQF